MDRVVLYLFELAKLSNLYDKIKQLCNVLYLFELAKLSNLCNTFQRSTQFCIFLNQQSSQTEESYIITNAGFCIFLNQQSSQTSNHFEVISELILYCEYSANSYNSIIHKSSSIIQHFSPSICGVCIASITIRYILLYIVNS